MVLGHGPYIWRKTSKNRILSQKAEKQREGCSHEAPQGAAAGLDQKKVNCFYSLGISESEESKLFCGCGISGSEEGKLFLQPRNFRAGPELQIHEKD